MRKAFAVLLAAFTAALPARAELLHIDTLFGTRGVSLAYDAQLCAIWVATEGPSVLLLSAVNGREILRLETELRSVRSLTVEEDGLLLADGWGRFLRIDRQGNRRDAVFSLSQTLRDTEGLHRDADGSFLVVEDDPSRLLRIAPDGTVLMELWGDGFDPPMVEPQGISRDLYSGNLLVVDDNEGLNALFELAPDGRVLSVTPLSEWGYDAEGVALQPETGRLFVGFDGGNAIAIFDWAPSQITIDEPLERGPPCAFS
ncbi:hypothetical protein [Thetidibacter halocola]|uniref:Phytase-like domain-containing protein n=1 Tax=Thetidibacter halocola TaxID=2827239 RepID=A0A8J8B8A5_9RHOB|nr:hypothetical protein [Thetidibacter halocola]MBS0124549.1 hypothetical protein [Thetidibacter halocola]